MQKKANQIMRLVQAGLVCKMIFEGNENKIALTYMFFYTLYSIDIELGYQ